MGILSRHRNCGPTLTQSALADSSLAFFDLPLEEKMALDVRSGGVSWRGYMPLGGEYTHGPTDWKEGLYMGPERADDHPLAGTHYMGGGKAEMLSQLEKSLKNLNLVSADLDDFTDQLLTLSGGIHVSPYESETNPPRNEKETSLLNALIESKNGYDATPYGEDV
ncbi:hypothetical protein G7Z17_g104 [Cylindrodendrum hubeiense]|uniref:Non-haem dioxygenase N-terminal domain-containing protein n=1 Tax=Cylindrodendrum hubeiense TaxID=595255 RepID=A0A9P5LGJ5_9HYPO|nr:hypothetical protein G7Z17_g104 [Cylindrodendrum hubeiense]